MSYLEHSQSALEVTRSTSPAEEPDEEQGPELEDFSVAGVEDDARTATIVPRGSACDPWSERYAAVVGTAGVFTPSDYDRLYAFLLSLPADGIRRITGQLSAADKKQCGRIVIHERK